MLFGEEASDVWPKNNSLTRMNNYFIHVTSSNSRGKLNEIAGRSNFDVAQK